MATYVSFRDGGKTDEIGLSRTTWQLLKGNALEGLAASQSTPLAMSISIDTGDIKIDDTGSCYHGWSDTPLDLSVVTADPSNPRIDRVVAFIDKSELPSAEVINNHGILKFAVISGVPANSPLPPSDTVVRDTIGVGNPYAHIALVTIPAGATQVADQNITDQRTPAYIKPERLANSAMAPFFVHRAATFSVTSGTFTRVPFNLVESDTSNTFNTATNRFTAPISGTYLFNVSIAIESVVNQYRYICQLNSNNVAAVTRVYDNLNGSSARQLTGTAIMTLDAGDWVEVQTWHNVGGTRTYPAANKDGSYFKGALLQTT